MKHQDVEKLLNSAYSKIETVNVLDDILSDCKKQEGAILMEQKKNNWTKILALACAVLLVIGLAGTSLWNTNKVMSVVAFDVNPSIELEMNQKEEVIQAIALNEDGQKILDGMNLKGVDLDVAVNALIGSLIKNGYINDLANSILVSVDSKDDATASRLQQELLDEISELIQKNNLDGAVIAQRIDLDDDEIEELASVYGITKAKTQLIKEILKTNNTHTFEDLVSLSIHDLNLIMQSTNQESENITSSGIASESKYIGKEKAIQIALTDAKLTQSQIKELDVDFDYENGKMIYEIEFEYQNQDYEYDIDALTGEILKIDNDDEKTNSQTTSTSYIGKEKAKSIALSDANVSESQISDFEIEFDSHDGIYEIEFHVKENEYEYEINATTGKIVKKEIDEYSSSSSNNYVDKSKIKDLVLNHANVNVKDLEDFDIDLEGSVYEVSFEVNHVEYEYKVNALTGEIISYTKH
ncbi:MAG: PepSY domain-containing protein [Traorella sp.]